MQRNRASAAESRDGNGDGNGDGDGDGDGDGVGVGDGNGNGNGDGDGDGDGEPADPVCGNGMLEVGEERDLGVENSDTGVDRNVEFNDGDALRYRGISD